MSVIVSLIYFILILSVIVIVHEFGHLIAAKKFGVYCKEFSIGMGPVIWKRQKGETQWSIRALPIGGFVAMAGEDEEGEEGPCGYGALLLRRAARAGPYAAPSSRYGKGEPVSGSAP